MTASAATAVTVPAGPPGIVLNGDLRVAAPDRGVVVFAHGSGSSRRSLRNRSVAQWLQHAGLATLLLDLLTEEEERRDAVTAEFRFDIALLAARVVSAVDWAGRFQQTATRPIGLFGASTGAAAALFAAAERPLAVRAVVSRGGRPDLAAPALGRVRAPTLLIVGERDERVIALNEEALTRLTAEKELAIVRGATHLFEEPGALDRVARLAADWFARHLAPPG